MSAEERRAHLARYPMVPPTPYTLREPAHLPPLPRQGPQRAAPITQPMTQAHRLSQIAAQLRARLRDDIATAAFGLQVY